MVPPVMLTVVLLDILVEYIPPVKVPPEIFISQLPVSVPLDIAYLPAKVPPVIVIIESFPLFSIAGTIVELIFPLFTVTSDPLMSIPPNSPPLISMVPSVSLIENGDSPVGDPIVPPFTVTVLSTVLIPANPAVITAPSETTTDAELESIANWPPETIPPSTINVAPDWFCTVPPPWYEVKLPEVPLSLIFNVDLFITRQPVFIVIVYEFKSNIASPVSTVADCSSVIFLCGFIIFPLVILVNASDNVT